MALVAVAEPYDFELSTGRFRAFCTDLANVWHDGALHRVVGGREVRIGRASGGVAVEPFDQDTERVVGKLLGLELDVSSFTRWAADDPTLAPLVTRLAGFRPPLAPDPFEALVTSITAQHVSLFAAVAIRNRLVERFGERCVHAYAFASRETLAAASSDDLVTLGFSRRKAEYVVELARADVEFDALARLSDEEVKARIASIRGLGEWTADWFLARHLARPHAWPAGDLALRKAVSAFYGRGRELSSQEVRAMAVLFAPFQNLAAHYLLLGHLTR